MTKARWTTDEDLLLVEKYSECYGDFEVIHTFFPERKKRSVLRRYLFLKQKSEEMQITIKDYIFSNKKDTMESICDLFCFESRNDKILNQIMKNNYKIPDVITAILSLSQQHNTLCLKLASNFKYLLNYWTHEILDALIQISKDIRAELFLQNCCFLNILDYNDLKLRLPFINDIEFFDSFPKVAIQSQEELLEITRLTQLNKGKSVRITRLVGDKRNLIEKVNQLKEKVKSLQQTNLTYSQIEQNIISFFYQNRLKIQTDFKLLFEETFKKNYILPKNRIDEYDLLHCMIKKILNEKNDTNFHKFCSLLYILNKNSYIYLKSILPICSPSTCKYFIRPFKHTLKSMIQDRNCIAFILEMIYDGLIHFENHKPVEPIYVTICGDAASLKPSFQSSSNAVYAFQMLPLKSKLPPAVFHLMECKNGPSNANVVKAFDDIIKYLKEIGFIVKYRATDGDISFDFVHDDFFEKYIEPNLDKTFDELVKLCSSAETIPLSDLLHLLKAARAKIINHLVMIDIPELKCLNTQLFADATNLGPVFNDRNSSGAMKDDYIFQLFSWFTFVEVMRKGRYDAAFYLLPYIYVLEAVRSPVLSLKNRIEFLKAAYSIFLEHYNLITQAPKNDLFQQRFHKNCIGTFYADKIFLRRMLNTIIGITVALYNCEDDLPMQRLSSHDSELFFGYMRFFSFFDHTYSNAVRAAVRSIILRKYSHDVNYPIYVSKRENNAGIILNREINERDDEIIDVIFLKCVVKELMLGHCVAPEHFSKAIGVINQYSSMVISTKYYKKSKIPHVLSGRLPFSRYKMMSYALSILPIPQNGSVFDYYMKNKNKNKRAEQINTLEWCLKIYDSIKEIGAFESGNAKLIIPFEYDLLKNEDRVKISKYINEKIHDDDTSFVQTDLTKSSKNVLQDANIDEYEGEEEEEDSNESGPNDELDDKVSLFIESLNQRGMEEDSIDLNKIEDPSSHLLDSNSIIDSIQISEETFEKINKDQPSENNSFESNPNDFDEIPNTNKKNRRKATYILRNNLTKTMNLLFSLFEDKNQLLISIPEIKSLLEENNDGLEINVDDEFHNAINNFGEKY